MDIRYQKLIQKALDKAIDKWDCLALGIGIELGTGDCALCAMFFSPQSPGGRCGRCPVKLLTGQTGCEGTPYENYYVHWARAHRLDAIFPASIKQPLCEKCRIIAQQEANFLRLLKTLYRVEFSPFEDGERPAICE